MFPTNRTGCFKRFLKKANMNISGVVAFCPTPRVDDEVSKMLSGRSDSKASGSMLKQGDLRSLYHPGNSY